MYAGIDIERVRVGAIRCSQVLLYLNTILTSGSEGVEHCRKPRKAPELGCNLLWKNAVFVNFHGKAAC